MQFISDTMNVVNQNRIISHKNINYKTYCSIISGATFWNFHNSLFSNKIWIQQRKVMFPLGDRKLPWRQERIKQRTASWSHSTAGTHSNDGPSCNTHRWLNCRNIPLTQHTVHVFLCQVSFKSVPYCHRKLWTEGHISHVLEVNLLCTVRHRTSRLQCFNFNTSYN